MTYICIAKTCVDKTNALLGPSGRPSVCLSPEMYEIASFGPKEYRINVTYTLIITPSKIGLGLGQYSVVEGIKAHLLT